MAIRSIRLYGDPVLSTPCARVDHIDESIHGLVSDLVDTVDDPGRAGVAACQIGVGLCAFSYHIDGEIGYLLNPEIVELGGEPREIDEGCLSVPGLYFPTPRYPYARVRGIDLSGEPVELEGEGLMAQALQHETDHLAGMVYIRRLTPEVRRAAMRAIRASDWFALSPRT